MRRIASILVNRFEYFHSTALQLLRVWHGWFDVSWAKLCTICECVCVCVSARQAMAKQTKWKKKNAQQTCCGRFGGTPTPTCRLIVQSIYSNEHGINIRVSQMPGRNGNVDKTIQCKYAESFFFLFSCGCAKSCAFCIRACQFQLVQQQK